MDKVSYALGLGIGQQLAQMGASNLNIDDFADAIKDVINGNELKVPHKDAQTIVQEYFNMMMFVDLTKSEKAFSDISDELTEIGVDTGVQVRCQLEDIFDKMHRI